MGQCHGRHIRNHPAGVHGFTAFEGEFPTVATGGEMKDASAESDIAAVGADSAHERHREAARAAHGLAVSRPLAADYDQQLQREYPQLGRYVLDSLKYDK
ncbi:MAG TPA: hypothetical protein PKA49_09860, partial [Tepidiformaceae bacterium]|nr:hypothetical protein [Tepidiformaceae bacterium]